MSSMFFCAWDERASLLVYDETEEKAREVATEVGEGIAPTRVVELPPRGLVLEVFFDDEEELAIEPLPHVAEALEALEAADDDACSGEAEFGEGEIVYCTRAPAHRGPHEGRAQTGERVEWDDEEERASA